MQRHITMSVIDTATYSTVSVLTVLAREVTARRAEGQNGRAGQEMVKWFFLDGIHTKTAGSAIGGEHHLIALAGAHETQPTLTIPQFAEPRAQSHCATIIQFVPVFSLYQRRANQSWPLTMSPNVTWTHGRASL